jgi:hypothetical protein
MPRITQQALFALIKEGQCLAKKYEFFTKEDVHAEALAANKEGRAPKALEGTYLSGTDHGTMITFADATLYFCVAPDGVTSLSVSNIGGDTSSISIRLRISGDVELVILNVSKSIVDYALFLLENAMMLLDPEEEVKLVKNAALAYSALVYASQIKAPAPEAQAILSKLH